MKHITWDYWGWRELKTINEFTDEDIFNFQKDWNSTLYTKINQAICVECECYREPHNIFISVRLIPILNDIVGFNINDLTVINRVFIPLNIITPRIYITKNGINDIREVKNNDFGSVLVLNYL